MKLLILNYLILFIASILTNVCSAYNTYNENDFDHQHKQRILLLNSYNQGYQWTDNIVRAISNQFKDNPNIIINIEYMDTKMINNIGHFERLKESIIINQPES